MTWARGVVVVLAVKVLRLSAAGAPDRADHMWRHVGPEPVLLKGIPSGGVDEVSR